jgi:hypothetical protein
MVRIFIAFTAGIGLLFAGAAAAASNEASTYAGLENSGSEREVRELPQQQEHEQHDGDVADSIGQHLDHADHHRMMAQRLQHEPHLLVGDQRRCGRTSASSAR